MAHFVGTNFDRQNDPQREDSDRSEVIIQLQGVWQLSWKACCQGQADT